MDYSFVVREYNPKVLCNDSSVELLENIDLTDWDYVHRCSRALRRTPLPKEAKQDLSDHLFNSQILVLARIRNPQILVYRFSNGEIRSFVCTQGGFLIENPEESLWDGAFPFVGRSSDCQRLALPRNIPYWESAGNYLWCKHSANYTHFLVDFFSVLAEISVAMQSQIKMTNTVAVFQECPSWQQEYLSLIPNISVADFSGLYNRQRVDLFWFLPKSIVLPIFNHKPIACKRLRSFIDSRFTGRRHSAAESLTGADVVLLTRSDERRRRIKNIDDIERYIRSANGHIVEPTQLTIGEKISLLSKPSIIIGESSGCSNFAYFANSDSRLISLVEPSSLSSRRLVLGGWTYSLGYADRSEFVVGSNLSKLDGSPLGAAEYDLESIKVIIERLKGDFDVKRKLQYSKYKSPSFTPKQQTSGYRLFEP